MTTPRDAIGLSERLIEGAKEALAVVRGEQPAARLHINGHAYVPATQLDALSVAYLQSQADLQNAHGDRDEAIKRRILAEDRADALSARVKELEAEREKLKLHIQSFVEKVQYHDSYGVPGSEFMACLCCRGGGAPGVELVHESHCPVERSLDTYQDWCDEQREFERESRENAARATRAEQERDEALERAAKVCDDFGAYEQSVLDRAHSDEALSDNGRKNIVVAAGSRQVAAEQLAYDIRQLKIASGPDNG